MKITKMKYLIGALLLSLSMLAPTVASAATKVKMTDAKYKEIMKAYAELFEDEEDFRITTFDIKDITGDNVPELIIDNGKVVFSYHLKEKTIVYIGGSYTEKLYYSESSNIIMFYDEGDVYSSWRFITVNDIQKVEPDSAKTEVATIYERRVDEETKKTSYVKVANGEETKVKKSTITAAVEKQVPNKIRIKSTIKNTKTNRTKYFTKVANFKSLATKK